MESKAFLFLIYFLTVCFLANANIRLPAVLSSNMVLQRNSAVKLWGWADPNEKVVINTSWNNNIDSTKGDANAKWEIIVQTPEAGGPYTITINGYNIIILQNILVGEVWVCSGQSNMEMNYMWGLPQMKADIPSALNKNIRFFQVPKNTAANPQEQGVGTWMLCDSNTVKHFSAVAYYFGKKLNANLNVPVGLIHASWGGTPAEVWTPSEKVAEDQTLRQAAEKLNPSNNWPIAPGSTFNAMIAPLHHFSIAGAIWYQGESNTGTANTYHQLFTTMITSWREKWSNQFPFYFVQLAPFKYGNNLIGAQLREAQLKSLALANTGIVVTTDLADDTADIHPRNKRDVGIRLANLALLKTYGQPIKSALSPMYKQMAIANNKATLTFDNAEDGLMHSGKSINGFFVAGADKSFHHAEAKIIGNSIVIWSKNVANPTAVRYAFTNTAIGNIFSKGGMPLSPFRTDDW
ncbi:MAG: sialate O-acetylesterase [Chitinophagaceae bacterium]|nr:MAG: sialate O-acetylesterase [Chitinophagaceae bacterium]